MNMKGKTREQKGITLIALIITIVVLLILAAVAISSIQGDGILGYATNASSLWNEASKNEQGTIGEYENYLKNHIGGEAKDEVTMLSGDGQTYYTLAPSTLSFRSSADINDFQEVQINGVTLDQSNYTLREGSTIVTLSVDYLKTLDADKHEITVVSKSGASTAGFEVIEPKVNEYNFYYNQPYVAYIDAYNFNVGFLLREDGTVNVAISEDTSIAVKNGTFEFIEGEFIVTQQDLGTFRFKTTDYKNKIYNIDLDVDFILDEQNIVADDDYVYAYSSSVDGYVATVIDNNKSHYGMLKSNINGKPIMRISHSMFENNTKLTSLPEFPEKWMIPNNTGFAWGENLFNGCTGLTTANIPDFFSALPYGMFSNCTNLKSVTIPDSVTAAGRGVFANCTSLTEIIFEGTVEQFMSIVEFKDYVNWETFENVPAKEVKCSDGTVTL